MSTNSRRIDSRAVQAIMQGRNRINPDAHGRTFEFVIQGNGNVIDVKDGKGELVQSITEPGTVLQKKIFNVRANSAIAQTNKRNVDYLVAGMAAEKAGNLEEAHKQFNDYLNATQMSFGILLPNTKADLLVDGVRISGTCELITTEKGSVMTIDPKSISILAPERAAKTTFNLADYLPAEEPVAASATTGKEKVKA